MLHLSRNLWSTPSSHCWFFFSLFEEVLLEIQTKNVWRPIKWMFKFFSFLFSFRLAERRLIRRSMAVRIDRGHFIGLFDVKNLLEILCRREVRRKSSLSLRPYRCAIFATVGDHICNDGMVEQCRERHSRFTIDFHFVPNGVETFLNDAKGQDERRKEESKEGRGKK